MTTPDGAVVSTDYSGNTVTVTDQAGKRRRSVTDGLGRLIRVNEPERVGIDRLLAALAGMVTAARLTAANPKAGVNYDKWIGDDFAHDAKNWATWIRVGEAKQ